MDFYTFYDASLNNNNYNYLYKNTTMQEVELFNNIPNLKEQFGGTVVAANYSTLTDQQKSDQLQKEINATNQTEINTQNNTAKGYQTSLDDWNKVRSSTVPFTDQQVKDKLANEIQTTNQAAITVKNNLQTTYQTDKNRYDTASSNVP